MNIIQVKIVQYYVTLLIFIVILVIEKVFVLIAMIKPNLGRIVMKHVIIVLKMVKNHLDIVLLMAHVIIKLIYV